MLPKVFQRVRDANDRFSLRTLAVLPLALLVSQGVTEARSGDRARELVGQSPASVAADGIYLYGEASRSNQIGSDYMVFELRRDRAVGGLYRPRSSFDCFYGDLSDRRLDLTIFPAYEARSHRYALNRSDDRIAIGSDLPVIPEFSGFQRIERLDAIDRDVLNRCRASLQDRLGDAVWQ